MTIKEIDLQSSFEDIQQFATNILARADTGSQFKDLDVQIEYSKTATNVLLVYKLHAALSSLEKSIAGASDASNQAAAAALTEARKMRTATWALVVATAFLVLVTGGLVWYTRLLESIPIIISAPPSPPRR